jgi:hypothetical protein
MSFKYKYLKYKNKYLELKNFLQKGEEVKCDNDKNLIFSLGTTFRSERKIEYKKSKEFKDITNFLCIKEKQRNLIQPKPYTHEYIFSEMQNNLSTNEKNKYHYENFLVFYNADIKKFLNNNPI